MYDIQYMAQTHCNSIKLLVVTIKQGKRYIAYSPALDLSSCGKTLQEAQKHFSETVKIFFEELNEKGTLEEVLKDLGWQKLKTKWDPPQVVSNKSFDFRIPATA